MAFFVETETTEVFYLPEGRPSVFFCEKRRMRRVGIKPAWIRLGTSLPKKNSGKLLRRVAVFLAASLTLITARPVMAVRPFITDDARVVGDDQWQLETSMRIDQFKVQNLNLFSYGLTKDFEFTLGWLDGYTRQAPYGASISGPLIQGKYLFLESKQQSWPGVALAVGASPPLGYGGLKVNHWSEFAFICLTETIFDNERWLIHANLGGSVEHQPKPKFTLTWGVGTQIRIWGNLCMIQEILSGDPYSSVQTTGGFFQSGFRYLFSDNIQADIEVGSGLWGKPKPDAAIGLGLRIVFGSLTGRKKEPKP